MVHIERRHYPRRRVFKGAHILFDDADVDSTVRGLSIAGATLELATTLNIPTDFTLIIPDDAFVGPCRVIWRKDKRLGIAFDDSMAG